MTIIQKIAAALISAALVAGLAWSAVSRIQSQAEQIGRLESQQSKLLQTVKDSEASAERVRQQLEMWQWLYNDLQAGYQEIREQRVQADAELAALKERQDVQKFLDCPMPDGLYEWVRDN